MVCVVREIYFVVGLQASLCRSGASPLLQMLKATAKSTLPPFLYDHGEFRQAPLAERSLWAMGYIQIDVNFT
jgi:hypothetical protein